MRKSVYLLAFLLLVSSVPGQVFAAIPNPPTNFGASPTDQGAIQLNWQNSTKYDNQILIRVDKPNNPLENLKPAPQGFQSSTDSNLNQPSVNNITIYQYQLQTTRGGETQTNDATVTFLDSDIVTVKTLTAAATTPYSIQCAPIGSNSIAISWNGYIPTPHNIQLYGAGTQAALDALASNSLLLSAPGPANFSFIDSKGLSPSTQRWYKLVTDGTILSNTVTCTTNAASSDAPSMFSVFSNNPTTLYLNWKDNVKTTRGYRFEIQRIKATPLADTAFAITARDAGSVSFSWKNKTTNSPFNSILERSTSIDPATRFSKTDKWLIPLQTAAYDPLIQNPQGNNVSFTHTDGGVNEATVYYYRLKVCSTFPVGILYTKESGENVVLNPDKPALACSDYIPAGTGALATTTLPLAPSDANATAVSPSSVRLTFKDNSGKEEGFYVYRNDSVTPVTTLGSSSGKGGLLTFTDSGLGGGTQYFYTVKSFISDPLAPGEKLTSDPSTSNSVTTPATLSISRIPASGGSVSGSGINCGTTCTNTFNVNEAVSLTATPASGFTFSKWTGDACNNSTNVSCSFAITGDTLLQAIFTSGTGGAGGNTINVAATLDGNPVASTNFSFSIVSNNDGSFPVPAGSHAVPLSASTNQTGAFTLNYVSGGPGIFSGINWSNSSGGGGGSGSPSTGLVPAGGGALSFTVRFTSAGAEAPSRNIASMISSAGVSIWKNLISFLSDGWGSIKESIRGIGVGSAQTPGYDNYFNLNKIYVSAPFYKNAGLDPNSVYIYRVRVVYDDGGTPASSVWAEMTAGKTLDSVNASPSGQTIAPICSVNSFCDRTITTTKVTDATGKILEQSESQCQVNVDCVNVGRSSKTFEER